MKFRVRLLEAGFPGSEVVGFLGVGDDLIVREKINASPEPGRKGASGTFAEEDGPGGRGSFGEEFEMVFGDVEGRKPDGE